jgi:hypothetical protein
MEVGKWVRNVAFHTHVVLGESRRQKRGRLVREVGWESRSSKTRDRKGPNTTRKGFKTREKGRLWRRREGVLCPRDPSREGRHSVGREWVEWGQEETL